MSRSSPGAGDPAATRQSCPPLFLRCALDTRSGPQPRTSPRWLVSWTMMLFFFFSSRLGSHPGSLQSTQLQKCCSGHLTHVACISPPATALGRPIQVLQVQNRALGAYRSLPRCEAREGRARGPHRLGLSTDWTAGVGTALHWGQPALREVLENFLFQYFSDFGSPLERRDTQSVGVSGVLCLLPASMKLWQADWLACKWDKISEPSVVDKQLPTSTPLASSPEEPRP
ncbi:uncharacterized protein LOC111182560 [Delphinapterus leucas]|uniref:Uncharacterized protein LOC111182560 n=1 Tax=Delphinapterus leucas TaxID=9749 RepID=A0A2Y9PN39_DELLE|nr:uncharacterized protein LOC111182560 [Delphinapterus leucas]